MPRDQLETPIVTYAAEDYNTYVSTRFPCVTADEITSTLSDAHVKVRSGGDMNDTCTLFTIGHSNHDIEDFIALLNQHGITMLVDVRSQPYSQWAHQFNREILQHDLQEADINYVYMGDVLGGRPVDSSFYTPGQERPDYTRMAKTPTYQAGIRRLLSMAQDCAITVMCSEGDHRQCHRHLLITQTLLDSGVSVNHIRPDGTCTAAAREPEQLTLFG